MRVGYFFFFFFSSRRRHTRLTCDWSSTCALPILVAHLKRALRHVVADLREGRVAWLEIERQPLQNRQGAPQIAMVKQIQGARELHIRWHDRGQPRAVVARRQATQRDAQRQYTDRLLQPHSGSAFPNALSFSCARCEIVSPGVPPASACW